jgi:integrase
VFADCGPRLGEVLPLERGDVQLGERCEEGCELAGPHLHIRRTAWRGRVSEGTKTDHGEAAPGRATPLPPVLAGMLAGLPRRIDTRLLFPTVSGRLFTDRNFYRDVWAPARAGSGVGATPHEFRHSYVSLMRAAGVDPADLAAWTGHSVLTATAHYTHATGGSASAARRAVG